MARIGSDRNMFSKTTFEVPNFLDNVRMRETYQNPETSFLRCVIDIDSNE